MARKTKHGEHGELKTESIQVRLTFQGKRGLEELAKQEQISVGELLERVGRRKLAIAPTEGEFSPS